MKKLATTALLMCLACGGAEEAESTESAESTENAESTEANGETTQGAEANGAGAESGPQDEVPAEPPEDLTRRDWAENEHVPTAAAGQAPTLELTRNDADALRESLAGALTSSSSPLVQQLGATLGTPHFRGERAHIGDFRLYDLGGRILLERVISGTTAQGRVVQTIATRDNSGAWSLMEPTELTLNPN